MPKALDLTNQKFGRLTAIKRAPNKNKKTYWECQCECGNIIIVQTCHLTDGRTKSCGCYKKDKELKPLLKDNINTRECILCGEEFTPNNINRQYCYNCIPASLSSSESIKLRDRLLKHKLVIYKGGKCERCGYDKCEGALTFHHIDPQEKIFTISHINLSKNRNLQYFYDEVDKCILLCANCHAEEHYT